MGLLVEIIFTLIAVAVGFLMARLLPVKIRFTHRDKQCLTLWISEKQLNILDKMAQGMNASFGNVIGCALSLLHHARDIYKRDGVLIQEIGDEEAEWEIEYTNNNGEKVILSGEEKHGRDLSDRDKYIGSRLDD